MCFVSQTGKRKTIEHPPWGPKGMSNAPLVIAQDGTEPWQVSHWMSALPKRRWWGLTLGAQVATGVVRMTEEVSRGGGEGSTPLDELWRQAGKWLKRGEGKLQAGGMAYVGTDAGGQKQRGEVHSHGCGVAVPSSSPWPVWTAGHISS